MLRSTTTYVLWATALLLCAAGTAGVAQPLLPTISATQSYLFSQANGDFRCTPGQYHCVDILDRILTEVRRKADEGDAAPSVKKIQAFSSPARDNTPIISADGGVMFFNSTRRGSRTWAQFDSISNRYDEDIYYSVFVAPGETPGEEIWSEPKNLGRQINTSKDDGVSAISPDGHTIYFNSLKIGWELDGGPYYRAQLRNTEWENSTGMGGGITAFFDSRDKRLPFRVYGASVSSDGRDFYFATSVHSPNDQMQIWVSHLTNGEWSYPENLGPHINNGEGSYAPYIATDGKTLYFASRIRGNNGEEEANDDIFMSLLRNGEWQKPVNVGAPVNTPGDESFMSVPASGDRLYVSSSQGGDDDIYLVSPLPRKFRPLGVVMLTGVVTDKVTGEPLEANISLEDLKTGEIIQASSSNVVNGKFTVILQPGHDYGVSVTVPGYVFLSDHYTVASNITYRRHERNFQMEKPKAGKAFVANNIFFDYDSATIRPQSFPELDRIAELLKIYPTASVQISGHTDNVGSDGYNFNLSQRRADAVKMYLTTTGGIEVPRVKTRGYGARKPVASNKTDDGRQKNRRTEFTLMKM